MPFKKALLSLKLISRRETLRRVMKHTVSDSWALPGTPDSNALFRLQAWGGGGTGLKAESEKGRGMRESARDKRQRLHSVVVVRTGEIGGLSLLFTGRRETGDTRGQ